MEPPSELVVQGATPDVPAFVDRYVLSFVKWYILQFFHDHPHTVETVATLAQVVQRRPEVVATELAELTNLGILEETRLGSTVVYALTADSALREQLDQFISACTDQRFRIKVVFHVIRGMSRQGIVEEEDR